MAYSQAIADFAQSVRLTTHGRYYSNLESDGGQRYISQVVTQANLSMDELENVVDAAGRPVYWNWMRRQNYPLGTALTGESDVDLDDGILTLIYAQDRKLLVTVDDEVVSRWTLVDASQINNSSVWNSQGDLVAQVDGSLIFNRPFKEKESNGVITADVVLSLPRLDEVDGTSNNDEALSLIKPLQLLVLCIAKNMTLPDIVQGGLSPSFVQKYNDLLQATILRNGVTNISDTMERDDFSYIGGVGF